MPFQKEAFTMHPVRSSDWIIVIHWLLHAMFHRHFWSLQRRFWVNNREFMDSNLGFWLFFLQTKISFPWLRWWKWRFVAEKRLIAEDWMNYAMVTAAAAAAVCATEESKVVRMKMRKGKHPHWANASRQYGAPRRCCAPDKAGQSKREREREIQRLWTPNDLKIENEKCIFFSSTLHWHGKKQNSFRITCSKVQKSLGTLNTVYTHSSALGMLWLWVFFHSVSFLLFLSSLTMN